MAEPKHITLRELQRRVKRTLDEQFALPLWVTAEISEIKVNYSGHCYLELVEKGGANGVPTAQARAVIWSSLYPRIATHFEEQSGQRLTSGLQILCKTLVTYHEIYGFSLQITDIDPTYTLGDMERQRQQTILQLQQEGVWEMNAQLTLPLNLQRIAIISSAQAAGYGDFCREIAASPYRFHLTLFDAFMQGSAAEESIVEALCRVAEQAEQFDAVVMIRGGGSASDLNCFNAYRLCAHIAQFPLPVITGIGHDKDISVADLVAYKSVKTPTAAAGWLTAVLDDVYKGFNHLAAELLGATRQRTHIAEMATERLRGDLQRVSQEHLTREEHRIAALNPIEAARTRIATYTRLLDASAEITAAYDPERVLRIGYALLRSGGRSITSASALTTGDPLEITLADGTITATVKNTTIWQRKR